MILHNVGFAAWNIQLFLEGLHHGSVIMTGRNIIVFVMNFYVMSLVCNYLKCKYCHALCIRIPGSPNLHNVEEGFTELVGLCKRSAVSESPRHTAVGDKLASFALGKCVLC